MLELWTTATLERAWRCGLLSQRIQLGCLCALSDMSKLRAQASKSCSDDLPYRQAICQQDVVAAVSGGQAVLQGGSMLSHALVGSMQSRLHQAKAAS